MDLNRRTLLETLAVVLASGGKSEAADLPAFVIDPAHARNESETYGSLRTYCDGPSAGLKHLVVGCIELNPGQQPHPPHTHVDEELLLVTDGAGAITINEISTAAVAGTLMYAPPNALHGIKNTGDKPLTFYFIKWIPQST